MRDQKSKINYLFRCIEMNDLDKIKEFFVRFPLLIAKKDKLKSVNDWGPCLHAARFGYLELLIYFTEELKLKDDRPEVTSWLILLSIHSGSLGVLYYLFKNIDVRSLDMVTYLGNSCSLHKKNISLFFCLKGTMIVDDVTISQGSNSEEIHPKCYNCYYRREGTKIQYYESLTDTPVTEDEPSQQTDTRSAKRKLIVMLSSSKNKKDYIGVINDLKRFGALMIDKLYQEDVKPRDPHRTSLYEAMAYIEQKKELKERVEVLLN